MLLWTDVRVNEVIVYLDSLANEMEVVGNGSFKKMDRK